MRTWGSPAQIAGQREISDSSSSRDNREHRDKSTYYCEHTRFTQEVHITIRARARVCAGMRAHAAGLHAASSCAVKGRESNTVETFSPPQGL